MATSRLVVGDTFPGKIRGEAELNLWLPRLFGDSQPDPVAARNTRPNKPSKELNCWWARRHRPGSVIALAGPRATVKSGLPKVVCTLLLRRVPLVWTTPSPGCFKTWAFR